MACREDTRDSQEVHSGDAGMTSAGPESSGVQIEEKGDQRAPDGGWGWFIVIGATLVHILMGGVERSTGVLYLEIHHRFQGSAVATSWLFSIFSTMRPLLGPVGSALSNRFSCRLVVFLGGLLASLSLITSAFAPSLSTLYFSFGVLGGIGQSLAYTPSLIIVGYYFCKRRGLAVGLATSGVGIGTFFLTPLFEILFSYYGYRGALLLMGGIVMNFVVAASLFRPLNLDRKNSHGKKCLEEDTVSDVGNDHRDDNDDDKLKAANSVTVQISDIQPYESNSLLPPDHAASQNADYMETTIPQRPSLLKRKLAQMKDVIGPRKNIQKGKQPLFEFSLLKNFHFLALCVCLLMFTVAYETTFVFLPSFVTSRGISKFEAASVISVIGICDAFSRIVSSIILDLKRVKPVRLYIYNGVLVFIGSICVTIPSAKTFAHFIACGMVFGLLTGVYKSQKSIIIVDILGVDKLSNSFGLLLLFQGIGSFIGPLAGGKIHDTLGNYAAAFYLGSVGIYFGSFILFLGSVKQYVHSKR